MFEPITASFDPQSGDVDSRLKVLWIEDARESRLAKDSRIAESFSIYRAYTPTDIYQELRRDRGLIRGLRNRVTFYSFPKFPFDGYLCDFMLDAQAAERQQGEAEETFQMRQSAQEAEAAGFTCGVLTSLSFEEHPAVVLPYTGLPSQIGSQRALIRLLCDSFMVLGSKEEELLKAKENMFVMLEVLSRTYRESMPQWCEEGWIQMSYSEKLRIADLAQERCSSGDVHWQLGDRIKVDTAYQPRWISLRSLWFDRDARPCRFDQVKEWLNSFASPQAEYLEALQLANDYFNLSVRPESFRRHRLAQLLAEHQQAKTETKALLEREIAKLGERLGLPCPEVLHPEFKLTLLSEQWPTKRHLMTFGANDKTPVRRLAVLMLMVKEFYLRTVLMQQEYDQEIEPLREYFTQNARDFPIDQSITINVVEGLERWPDMPTHVAEKARVLLDYGIKELYWEEGQVYIPTLPSPEASDIHRRIDPLPAAPRSHWDSINREIKRDGLNLRLILASDPGGGLRTEERRELQRYAGEIGFPRSFWPAWLQS